MTSQDPVFSRYLFWLHVCTPLDQSSVGQDCVSVWVASVSQGPSQATLGGYLGVECVCETQPHMPRRPTSLIIRRMHIKTTVRSHFVPTTTGRIKTQSMTGVDKDVAKLELLQVAGGMNPVWTLSAVPQSSTQSYHIT